MDNQTLRILLIEDDIADATIVERRLIASRQDFVLQHCECLEDALASLEQAEFDVVLLDLSLPDSFGLSALDKIRPCAPDLPIVVLTGLSDDDLAMQSLEQGAQDYLVKDYATADLLKRTLRYAVQRQQIQTENRRLLTQMEVLARHDCLTGVLNRHSFAENLEREWQRADRYQDALACVVLDIDFFKRVNDTFGHAAGDRVLKQVANTLCLNSRATDFVGRLGGEEFCVLLTGTNEEDAVLWSERVRLEIARLEIPIEDNELRITISLGVACRRDGLCKPEEMIDEADAAMFVAKQLGRDRVVSSGKLKELGRIDRSDIWHGITVKQLMSPLAVSLTSDQPIGEALQLIQSCQSGSIAVLDAQGKLAGAIGEDDVLAAVLTSDVSRSVGELMKTQLVTYSAETSAREVCEFLCRAAIRQVFIVDGFHPLGVVRRTDFIRWLGQSNVVQNQDYRERTDRTPNGKIDSNQAKIGLPRHDFTPSELTQECEIV